MIPYPQIDPVAIGLGPLKIRWYGLMYVIGFAAGWLLLWYRAGKPGASWKREQVDDLLFYTAVGLLLGARLGYVLFYGFDTALADPLYVLRLWEGGMSFHGGLLGVVVAMIVYAKRQGTRFFTVTDFIVPAIPPGIFAGRIGNFINGELWGKPTDVPWSFIVNGEARHPSQLYEAALEGLLLFCVLWWFSARPRPRMAVSGLFLSGYGVSRFAIEFVRIPDAHIGYLAFGWLTMGQVLTTPMIVVGLVLLLLAYGRSRDAPAS